MYTKSSKAVCPIVTIKHLKYIKFLFCLEEFKVKADIITLFHCNGPCTHLEVWIAIWVARAQYHSG